LVAAAPRRALAGRDGPAIGGAAAEPRRARHHHEALAVRAAPDHLAGRPIRKSFRRRDRGEDAEAAEKRVLAREAKRRLRDLRAFSAISASKLFEVRIAPTGGIHLVFKPAGVSSFSLVEAF